MKTKHTELVEWRASHFQELESTLGVLKGIRDDPEASNKDRIEASKGIGRLLSAMSPAKTDSKKGTTVLKQENRPTEDEMALIYARINN